MRDPWHSIKISEFEHVLVSPSVTLMRISGKGPRRQSGDRSRPVLLAESGPVVKRISAIPSPPDGRGLLRAAYSVSTDLITASTAFSLECSDGSVVALPAPTEGAARLDRRIETQPAPEIQPSPDPVEPAAAEKHEVERRSGLVSKLTELSANLAESQAARSQLETEAVAARAEADERVRATRAQADEDARTMLGQEQEHAQARLAEVQTELEQRATLAEQRADGAVLEAAAARDEIEMLQERNQAMEATLTEHRQRITELETEVAEAIRAHDELEQSVEPLRSARLKAEQELAEADEAMREMTAERDELARQAAAFDGVAVKARERAAQAESEAGKATSSLQELDIWRGELERRLTDTTDELNEAKAGRRDDQVELRRLGGELAEAEAKVELMQAQIGVLTDQLERSDGTPDPEPLEAGEPEAALAALRTENDGLRIELAEAREVAADAQAEAVRQAAEAQAREQAEFELRQAAKPSA